MSLRGLAKKLEITPSAVSQIELGLMQPSVNRLLAMVTVLGVPLSDVFETAEAEPLLTGHILARSGHHNIVKLDDGVLFRRLSPSAVDGIDFFESTYPPLSTASGQRSLMRHEGIEVGTVRQGELTIDFEAESVVLRVGDSISYPCADAHFIHNASTSESAIATWLILHPRR